MPIRMFVISLLVLILNLSFTGSPSATQTRSLFLTCLSPPDGLEIPMGQGIEIDCRWEGEAEVQGRFLVDGVLLREDDIPAGGLFAASWIAKQAGPHRLTLMVVQKGQRAAQIDRLVQVGPVGSPVRVP